MMYSIQRPINGISLNGNEKLVDSDNQPILFKTYDEAVVFLLEAGFHVGEAEYMVYEEEDIYLN